MTRWKASARSNCGCCSARSSPSRGGTHDDFDTCDKAMAAERRGDPGHSSPDLPLMITIPSRSLVMVDDR
jgi:hypothetical protein